MMVTAPPESRTSARALSTRELRVAVKPRASSDTSCRSIAIASQAAQSPSSPTVDVPPPWVASSVQSPHLDTRPLTGHTGSVDPEAQIQLAELMHDPVLNPLHRIDATHSILEGQSPASLASPACMQPTQQEFCDSARCSRAQSEASFDDLSSELARVETMSYEHHAPTIFNPRDTIVRFSEGFTQLPWTHPQVSNSVSGHVQIVTSSFQHVSSMRQSMPVSPKRMQILSRLQKVDEDVAWLRSAILDELDGAPTVMTQCQRPSSPTPSSASRQSVLHTTTEPPANHFDSRAHAHALPMTSVAQPYVPALHFCFEAPPGSPTQCHVQRKRPTAPLRREDQSTSAFAPSSSMSQRNSPKRARLSTPLPATPSRPARRPPIWY